MSLAGLSLRDLEYAVAVAECRHFGHAADRCAVSQPALSAQIRKLEGVLGVTLFERLPGRVRVTRQGEAVLSRARLLLADARHMLAAARDSAAPLAGPLRLGAIATLGPYLLPHVLRPLRETFPAMQLELTEGLTAPLLDALQDGSLDAVLACLPQDAPGLCGHALFFEPFLVMAARGEPADLPSLLESDRLLLLADGHCLRDQVTELCGVAAPRARRHATGLEMLRHMVAAGEGASLVPALAAMALGDMNGLITYAPLAKPAVGRDVGLLVRRSDPRAEHLRDLAATIARHTPAPGVPPRRPD